MARPKKQVVDYFPHTAQQGKTLFILESRWGNDGYAFWFKLLESLCQTNGHVYDYGNPAAREFLLAKTKVNDDLAVDILNKLAELGKIDSDLWSENKIWCQNLVNNVRDAYKKRIDEIPEKPSLSSNKLVTSEFPTPETPLNEVSVDGSAQSKVKESKVKDIKVNKNTYTPEFELFWFAYPEQGHQNSKLQSSKNFATLIKKKVSADSLIQAAKNYAIDCKTEEKTDYLYKASNFVGRDEYYRSYLNDVWIPVKPKGGEKVGADKQSTGTVQAEDKYSAAKNGKFFA